MILYTFHEFELIFEDKIRTDLSFEKTIWNRIAEGDKEAYAEAYRHFFARFYNYGCKFTRDHVLIEDAIQETLLLVWDKRDSLSSINFVSTYFFCAFRNKLFTKMRGRQTRHDGNEPVEPEFSVEQILIEKEIDLETKQSLHRAIEALTSRQREAIFLRFYEGLSYEEVASVLKITTKATYKIVARALEQLRKLMPCLLFLIHRLLN